jgi:hypothetical protein
MDTNLNIQKTEDLDRENLSDKDSNHDEFFSQIMDKAEQLTAALYRVTDLYLDKEPMKWSLRDNAIVFYNNLVSVINNAGINGDNLQNNNKNPFLLDISITTIGRVIDMLNIASLGSFVSNANFEILKTEYKTLRTLIEGNRDNFVVEQKLLMEASFPVSLDSIGHFANGHNPNGQDKGHSNGHNKDTISSQPKKNSSKRTTEMSDKNKGKITNNSHAVSEKNTSSRRQKILEFVRKNGKCAVTDIALVFTNISSKTIQRDLFDLVKSGDLMAEGEKRWRAYFSTH